MNTLLPTEAVEAAVDMGIRLDQGVYINFDPQEACFLGSMLFGIWGEDTHSIWREQVGGTIDMVLREFPQLKQEVPWPSITNKSGTAMLATICEHMFENLRIPWKEINQWLSEEYGL